MPKEPIAGVPAGVTPVVTPGVGTSAGGVVTFSGAGVPAGGVTKAPTSAVTAGTLAGGVATGVPAGNAPGAGLPSATPMLLIGVPGRIDSALNGTTVPEFSTPAV